MKFQVHPRFFPFLLDCDAPGATGREASSFLASPPPPSLATVWLWSVSFGSGHRWLSLFWDWIVSRAGGGVALGPCECTCVHTSVPPTRAPGCRQLWV